MATYTGIKEILKEFRDRIYPVGVIYIQFPQQKSPEELFPGMTWEELDYDGAFFRASGGNADGFIEESGDLSKQAEGLPDITGSILPNDSSYFISAGIKGKGAFTAASTGAYFVPEVVNRTDLSYRGNMFAFSAANGETTTDGTVRSAAEVYGKSDHVTPENYTMRIWKRTA